MFELIYARSVEKDLRRIPASDLKRLRNGPDKLREFPNLSSYRQLRNHPLADYRLRSGKYRVLFDVDWPSRPIHILKIGTRQDVYEP
ncbi:type II toxin-antitoxin system RelE/ParE family toxin [Sulfurivirga sp.]|uniref:type II toxin-antitoxin system RelE family toxin n=1 Tax=Sulfurivirga sp. TaxID=2614236 RepID=UPI0025F35427|nr:type II toxin-antitoxin system RelE/ParE family toxin [Sulfurivirga sp.]